MKVRIGIGVSTASPDALVPALAAITERGFDSVWLPELLTGATFDPLLALAWAAASHPRLKLGTTLLLPGRNIIRLASQLASLDVLSAGRLLVTFVPGINQGAEAGAIGVDVRRRRDVMADALAVLRALMSGESVSHDGPAGTFTDVRLSPLPVQQPLEFWLGGTATRSLELCGRLGDGWLPSLLTPEQAFTGRERIEAVATEHGRTVDPEHFGVSIGYQRTPLSAEDLARLTARSRGADVRRLVPIGPEALRARLQDFVAAGFSKFVLRPAPTVRSWPQELALLADEVLDLQS